MTSQCHEESALGCVPNAERLVVRRGHDAPPVRRVPATVHPTGVTVQCAQTLAPMVEEGPAAATKDVEADASREWRRLQRHRALRF